MYHASIKIYACDTNETLKDLLDFDWEAYSDEAHHSLSCIVRLQEQVHSIIAHNPNSPQCAADTRMKTSFSFFHGTTLSPESFSL